MFACFHVYPLNDMRTDQRQIALWMVLLHEQAVDEKQSYQNPVKYIFLYANSNRTVSQGLHTENVV